jgi:truncated hemoglobin YjbI/ferredoxin
MPDITYQGQRVHCRDGETVLDALTRHGLDIAFSCKSGVCRRCMLRCTQGEIPARMATYLPPPLLAQGLLLACQCRPRHDLTLTDASSPAPAPAPSPAAEELPSPATLPPNPGLWAALGHGQAVRTLLERFYARVYADPVLSPFFERVTLQRVVDKQYAFMCQCITGEPVYLGEQPDNAHHWMVISDEVFERRQRLMQQTQADCGWHPDQMSAWAQIEERFRADIVKHRPRPKRIGNLSVDTEGLDSVVLDVGTVCDHCGQEIAAGTLVQFHKRLGHVGCRDCTPLHRVGA